MTLSLKQMQDLGIHKFMNDKEVATQLGKALAEQNVSQTSTKEDVPHKNTLDYVLELGGVIKYKHNTKIYSISVITASDYELYEKQQMGLEDDIDNDVEYFLPPLYKFHVKNAFDNRVSIRAKTYTEAQSVIDAIYGKGMYKVSASTL